MVQRESGQPSRPSTGLHEVVFLTTWCSADECRPPVDQIDDDKLVEIADRARQLMSVNVRSGPQVTTGQAARGRDAWVYGRAGKPCWRCATAVAMGRLGDRITDWCPVCQPP